MNERAFVRAVTCASHKHIYPWGGWRQSGWRRGCNRSSMNISVGLFTYSFCRYSRIRWRAIGSKPGPQPSAMETSSRSGDAERESEGRKRALRGCWTLCHRGDARDSSKRKYTLPLWRGISEDAKSMFLLSEAVSWKRYVNSWESVGCISSFVWVSSRAVL